MYSQANIEPAAHVRLMHIGGRSLGVHHVPICRKNTVEIALHQLIGIVKSIACIV
jgi:hypothetical protein